MKNYFLKMFKYNEWANDRILALILDASVDERTIKLFSHIINAQRLWLDRILNRKSEFEVWGIYDEETCLTLSKENSLAWIKFIEMLKEEDLKKEVDYVTTKGDPFRNTVEEIITQVINHSTYHRAQIAMNLRNNDIEPPVTDFIVYMRE